MSKTLIIVESPSKAKTISGFLGRNYKVVASKGHIRDLPKSKLGVDIENDFEPQYINIRGKGTLINELKKEAKEADKVYLATDPDREGEAIAWHLSYVLGIDPKTNCRITFNEITKNTVENNIKNPRSIDMNLTDAQQARRVLDRIVGYKLSPILWKKIRAGLSAGRVQSVAVKIICDREEEIEKFIPEEYWNINMIFSKDSKKFASRFYGIDGKKADLHNKQEVDNILDDLENAKYIVKNVKKGSKKRSPAPPFTTSTMQQEASRKLGFPIKKTMMIAQMLYEAGKITYMRTDSTRISEDARKVAKGVISKLYGENYYNNRYYKVSKNAQDGHEGIRPTSIETSPESLKSALTLDQYKLYNLIYKRFLASQMSDAIYDTLQVSIDSQNSKTGKDYNFRASGQTLKFKGFMTLYVEDNDEIKNKDNEIQDENQIPELNIGDEVKKEKINPKQSFTEPPARFTEASLVKFLEEKEIGRPSTYATIISTIIDREYVEREQKQLVPTELGKVVNKFLCDNFQDIVNIEFTAKIENELDDIANGKENWKIVVKRFYEPFEKELEKAEKETEHLVVKDEETGEICEKCGRPMVIKRGRFGKFLACSGYPECKNAKPFYKKAANPCPVCGSPVYVRKTKKGRNFYICSENKNDGKSCPYISWNAPKIGEKWEPSNNKTRATSSNNKYKRKTSTNKTTKAKKTASTSKTLKPKRKTAAKKNIK